MPVSTLLIIAGTIVMIVAIGWYALDSRDAAARFAQGSQIVQTARGPVEYALNGRGIPILVSHGAGGGYEQGLLLTRVLDSTRYQIIGLSRPGYRRTPLVTGPTHADQADMFTALLDALHIEKVAVVGVSAGGLAAIQFAARHPDRCRALILISAVGPGLELGIHGVTVLLSTLFQIILRMDFPMWLLIRLGPAPFMLSTGGIDFATLHDPARRALIDGIMAGMLPLAQWRLGTINDIAQVAGTQLALLDEIKVPTLILHGTRDAAVPVAVARRHAERIARAQLVLFEGGTHLVIGTRCSDVAQAIDRLFAV